MDAAPALPTLSRAHSSLIRDLLHEKKARAEEGAFVVEGAKACLDLIRRHPQTVLSLTLSSRYLRRESESERRLRANLAVRQFVCSESTFQKLSDVEAPQGVLAVVRQPQWDENGVLGGSRVLGIYGDRLQDPANVGAIIRTAAALNLTGLWLSPDSADHFGPKVVRVTAATLLSLPVFRTSDIRALVNHHCALYSALVPSPGTISLKDIRSVPRRVMIAVGNEGAGLAGSILNLSAVKFAIPLGKNVESLNVAATVAIAAFYLNDLPIEG